MFRILDSEEQFYVLRSRGDWYFALMLYKGGGDVDRLLISWKYDQTPDAHFAIISVFENDHKYIERREQLQQILAHI